MTPASDIRCEDVTVAYGRHVALRGVTGTFTAGTMTAVIGTNGAGKSTLLKAIAGETSLARGRIDRGDGGIAVLPQQAAIDKSFPISVADVALLGLWRELGSFRRPSLGQRARLAAAIETVGLAGFEARAIGTLSAGQMQRVLFARLILQASPVVLLDEPFAAIDEETTNDLLSLLKGWHAAGRTIIAVLHDLPQVRRHFPQTLLLSTNALGWGPTENVLSATEATRGSAPLPRADTPVAAGLLAS